MAGTSFEEHVGARSERVTNAVERGAVRKFAEAIGDLNPLYLDREAAARSRWGRLIAPPTFPRVFDFGDIEEIELPEAGVIHGEQAYDYTRPLFVGEELDCYTVFEETYEKKGRAGRMRFLVLKRVAEDSGGEQVMTTRDVYILTEAVLGDEDGAES